MVLLTAAERRSPFPGVIAPVRFVQPDPGSTPLSGGAAGPAPNVLPHRTLSRLWQARLCAFFGKVKGPGKLA